MIHVVVARSVLGAVIVALIVGSSFAPVAARQLSSSQKSWDVLYDEGIRHVQRREWADAEAKLAAAKKTGPAPGRRVLRYGGLRDDFFPDYYLGVVYQNTNRPREAVAALERAKTQGVNTEDREFQQFETLAASASAAVAKATSPSPGSSIPGPPGGVTVKTDPDPTKVDPPVANPPVANPPAANPPVTNAPVTKAPVSNAPVPAPGPSPAEALNAARKQQFDELLSQARTLLAQRNYSQAHAVAVRARDLKVDQAQAAALIRQITTRLGDEINAALNNGNAQSASAALARLTAIDPAAAEPFRVRLSALAGNNRRAVAERAAMQQFYGGDYSGAIATLDASEKSDTLSPRAYFYRACSLAALALRSGNVDSALLTQARQQYAQALKGRSAFERDEAYISPKIRDAIRGQQAYN